MKNKTKYISCEITFYLFYFSSIYLKTNVTVLLTVLFFLTYKLGKRCNDLKKKQRINQFKVILIKI